MKDLNIKDLVCNALKNSKQFNQLNKRNMNDDIMTDLEFAQWVNKVTDKATRAEIDKNIPDEAGI